MVCLDSWLLNSKFRDDVAGIMRWHSYYSINRKLPSYKSITSIPCDLHVSCVLVRELERERERERERVCCTTDNWRDGYSWVNTPLLNLGRIRTVVKVQATPNGMSVDSHAHVHHVVIIVIVHLRCVLFTICLWPMSSWSYLSLAPHSNFSTCCLQSMNQFYHHFLFSTIR